MTARHLVEMLLALDDLDIPVKAYNGDSEQLEEVSGMLYGGADQVVELCTDDMGG